jgi:multiple sugar transport system permease protein
MSGSTSAAPLRQRYAPPRVADRRRRMPRVLESLTGYAFLAPNLILLGVFLILPLVWALVLSFQNSNGFGTPQWTGLGNYVRLFTDPVFWRSLGNTSLFTAVTVVGSMAIGLGLAVLMNTVLPARPLFRTIIYLPMVISGVATGLVGVLIFDENTGILDKLLRLVGLTGVPWQSNGMGAMAAVVIATLWTRVGFTMVIYLAGLQGIEPELYEAADLEGATGWQRFRFITFPLLGSSTFFLMIMNVIYSFQVFDIVFVLTGGGPGYSTSMLVTYAYQQAFTTQEQGYAAAIGIVILLIMLVFTALQWRSNSSKDTTA